MVEVQKLVTCITKHDKIRAMGRKACMRKGWIGFAENMLKKLNNGSSKKMSVLTLRSGKIERGGVKSSSSTSTSTSFLPIPFC